jgi:serine/threonine protein phosphatase PrpC
MPGGVLYAAGLSDVGRQRDVNEDRLHIDVARGIFIVVDGVGGHAAGGRAADLAVQLLRERLERQTGPLADRVREAVTIANNEIFHAASRRSEWQGMACVLTVVVVEDGRAVVGHVGDTRLYRLRAGQIVKITPDHSPVGEREDAREISELEAMRHPRRNEVFRDVGSSLHALADSDFVFVSEIEFPPDASLLICSDGLTDLVPLDGIRRCIEAARGRPSEVVASLVQAANEAGGRDNVTAVYVEGDAVARRETASSPAGRGRSSRVLVAAVVALMLAGMTSALAWRAGWLEGVAPSMVTSLPAGSTVVVQPGESIQSAIDQVRPGTTILVEPGEYRERLTLKSHVRIISRIPRGAVLRLPAEATEQDAAIVAAGAVAAEVSGFRIVGDAATPLGLAAVTRDAIVRFVDIEVTGATVAAVDIGAGDGTALLASDIQDNPGTALVVRAGAAPRIVHNTFARNAASDDAVSAIVVEPGAAPHILQNVFHAADAQAVAGIDGVMEQSIVRDNWFVGARPALLPGAERPSGRSR